MKKSSIRYHLPMCSSTYANTRKPIALKITICSRIQNKRVLYFRDDVADELQEQIDFVFGFINKHTQDFVIEHLTDLNPTQPSLLVELKVNVFGITGKRLLDVLSFHKAHFKLVK